MKFLSYFWCWVSSSYCWVFKGNFSKCHQQNCVRSKIPSRKWVLIMWMKIQGDPHPLSQYQGFLWSSTSGSMVQLEDEGFGLVISPCPPLSRPKQYIEHTRSHLQTWWRTWEGKQGEKPPSEGQNEVFLGGCIWWIGRGPPVLAANTVDWDFPWKLVFTCIYRKQWAQMV